jgi:hypothetical protein
MAQGIITGSFLFNVEKGYRVIYENSYLHMLDNMWWNKLVKVHNTDTKSERFEWLIQTAGIDQLTPADGGESVGPMDFEELSTAMLEIAPARFGKGFRISKMKWLNMLSKGMDPVAEWVRASGAYAAYRPQRSLAELILNGANVTGYDGVPFWSKVHPNHPNIPGNGTYANTFTGAASGSYPGALPIDDSVTVDAALTNLTKALAYISGAVSQPNGQDCRMLEPLFLIHPPRMVARVQQLTNTRDVTSNIIAQLATGGAAAGSADIRAIIKNYNLTEPIEAKELDGNRSFTFGPPNLQTTVTGDDKTFYIVCREAGETQLGAFLMNNRQPFTFRTYSGESGAEGIDAVLGRSQSLEWQHDGYFSINPGHPFAIFQFKGA